MATETYETFKVGQSVDLSKGFTGTPGVGTILGHGFIDPSFRWHGSSKNGPYLVFIVETPDGVKVRHPSTLKALKGE